MPVSKEEEQKQALQLMSDAIIELHERNSTLEADLALAIKRQGELEAVVRDIKTSWYDGWRCGHCGNWIGGADKVDPQSHMPNCLYIRAQSALHGTPAAAPEETK